MKKRVLLCLLLTLLLASMLALPVSAEGEEGGDQPEHTHEYIWDRHTGTCACGATTTSEHSWGNYTVVKAADCVNPGSATETCSICSESKTLEIPATGHVFSGTCTSVDAGNHSRECTVCHVTETTVHAFGEPSVTKTPSCTEEGERMYVCTACGYQKTEKLPITHSYGSWVNGGGETHYRACAFCDTKQEAGHNWVETGAILEPTCETKGAIQYVCTDCGGYGEYVLDALGHKYDNDCDADCNTCGAEREAEHKVSKVWTKNGTYHWHACSACGEKFDEAKHYPGPAATEEKPQVCLVCLYEMMPIKGHTHEYADKLTSDATGHWYPCDGCEDKKDFKEHVYDDLCDPDCNECGYTSETAHSYGEEYLTDEEEHWQVCTLCGEESEHEAHKPGPEATEEEPQLCIICDYELVAAIEHIHEPGEEWMSDEECHWYACECGEKLDEASHMWDEGTENEDSTVTYVCSVCEAEKTEGEPKEAAAFPWWIVSIVAGVVCVVAAVLLFIFMGKKKEDDEDDYDYDED